MLPVLCTMLPVLCTMLPVLCTMLPVLCTMLPVLCTMLPVLCTMLPDTGLAALYTVKRKMWQYCIIHRRSPVCPPCSPLQLALRTSFVSRSSGMWEGILKLQHADSGGRIGPVWTTLPRESEKHDEIRKVCPTEGVTSGTVKPTYWYYQEITEPDLNVKICPVQYH